MSVANPPVVNIASLTDSRTLRTLDNACRTWGIFQVVGHGMDKWVTKNLMRAMQDFFNLPTAAKHSVIRTEKNHWGYYDKELTKNRLDCKEIYDYGQSFGDSLQSQLPSDPPNFEQALKAYFALCEQLSFNLLDAIGANLGLPTKHLHTYFQPLHSSFLRLNYYPLAAKQTEQSLGIHPHTDAGAITILLQDGRAGLEVQVDDDWQLIEPLDDAVLVNLGDIVQVWSNDRYRAPLHRVLASRDQVRYSAPFFFNPHFDAVYEPLATTVDSNNPPKYRPIHWQQFRQARAQGDYDNYGHEIQIQDFRI